jgi:nitroreductase
MELEQVIRKRSLIREFDGNEQIPEKVTPRNAHRAPSTGHTQVQKFVIVKNPTMEK